MASEKEILEGMTDRALSGIGAHVAAADVFAGPDWKLAGVSVEGRGARNDRSEVRKDSGAASARCGNGAVRLYGRR